MGTTRGREGVLGRAVVALLPLAAVACSSGAKTATSGAGSGGGGGSAASSSASAGGAATGGASASSTASTGGSLAASSASSSSSSSSGASASSTSSSSSSSGSMLPTTSLGRVALFQIFDDGITPANAKTDASRYDFVWGAGSGNGATAADWRAGSASTVLSRYMVFGLDYKPISGHDLTWWQANHPEMILYCCDGNHNPTKVPALEPSALPDDIGLDLENDAATDLEVSIIKAYMTAHPGFDAVAIDQFITTPMYSGYNPSGDNHGQTGAATYYGCGVYPQATAANPFAGTFKTEYSGKNDTKWFTDAIHYAARVKQGFGPKVRIVVNHPTGSVTDPNEKALLQTVDGTLDETGFGGYGKYQNNPNLVKSALAYMVFAQQAGAAAFLTDNFAQGASAATTAQIEWAIGTYELGNDGAAALFLSPNGGSFTTNGYGLEHDYPEYATVDAKLGTPCGPYTIPDPMNAAYVYVRKFTGGFVAVNAGSGAANVASQKATLPNHTYTDLENKTVTNPLTIASSDAYVLFTTAGTGCN